VLPRRRGRLEQDLRRGRPALDDEGDDPDLLVDGLVTAATSSSSVSEAATDSLKYFGVRAVRPFMIASVWIPAATASVVRAAAGIVVICVFRPLVPSPGTSTGPPEAGT